MGQCNIRAQHPFLRKTSGWFICRSSRKSYTTHYAFKPRIIIPKHPLRRLANISFVPIKGNRILLFAKYFEEIRSYLPYLHLSIHEIRSDHRVGPVLWSFNGSVDGHFDTNDLELIKSAENALGITFGVQFDDHWKLFNISTTHTDTLDNFSLIESGRVDFNLELNLKPERGSSFGLSQISCSHVELALMCSPSHTIPWQAHSSKHIFGGRAATQRNDWHSLFGFWWHKQCELFLCNTHVHSLSRVPRCIYYLPCTKTCIFCRWVQVCYGYELWCSGCLGYPKQSSLEDIHGRLQVRPWWPAYTIPSIQQWKFRKRSAGICKGTSEVHILISPPLNEFLAPKFPPSWNHSCHQCDDGWDGGNSSLKARRTYNVPRSGGAFLRSNRENSVRWT